MPPFLQHKCTLVFQTSFSWRNSILVLQSLSPQLLLLVVLSSDTGPMGGPCHSWQDGFPTANLPTKAVSHLDTSTLTHDEPSLVPTLDIGCLENSTLQRSHLQFIKQISNTSGHLHDQ